MSLSKTTSEASTSFTWWCCDRLSGRMLRLRRNSNNILVDNKNIRLRAWLLEVIVHCMVMSHVVTYNVRYTHKCVWVASHSISFWDTAYLLFLGIYTPTRWITDCQISQQVLFGYWGMGRLLENITGVSFSIRTLRNDVFNGN